MTGHFQGVASRALELVGAYDDDLDLAAGHAVLEARELVDLDPREARRWLTIAEMLTGKYGEEVGHA